MLPACLSRLLPLSLVVAISITARAAETTPGNDQPPLPGKGLAQHDFLYAGESKDRKMFIIREGKVVWSYDDPAGKGEISDAVMLSNGNILLAHQYAVKLITPEKRILWEYTVPAGGEVHTAQPIGARHVLYVQNGDPALIRVVDITSNATVKELNLPVRNPKGVHGQLRHARLTPRGTLLVAHMDGSKICEYDAAGKELWSHPTGAGVWGVTPLGDERILYIDKDGAHEVDRQGRMHWECLRTQVGAWKFRNLQLAWRLKNGNTLINNWANQWAGQVDRTQPSLQALEVTPDKQVVWVLQSWSGPDLGPATTIQVLEPGEVPEDVHFGDIR